MNKKYKIVAGYILALFILFLGASTLIRHIYYPNKLEALENKEVIDGFLTHIQGLSYPSLVNVWASWCVPCVTELPLLAKLSESTGMQLHLLNIDKNLQDANNLLDKLKLSHLHNIHIKNMQAIQVLNLRGIPTTFMLDKQGKILWRISGEIKPAQLPQLKKWLNNFTNT